MRVKNGFGGRVLRTLPAAVFWLLVWQLAAGAVNQTVVLSPPLEVIRTLIRLMGSGGFWLTLAFSFLRILSGYLIGILLGLLLALLTRWSRIARSLISPFMSVLKATPVASFIILLLFMARNQHIPVLIAAIIVLPLVWANVTKGLEETDRGLLEMGTVFDLSAGWQIRHIYGPSVKAYFLPAAVTALGLAWKAGVAAEVLAAPEHSVGGMLYRAKLYLETPEMLAWTLCVILISMGLEQLLTRWMKRMD